MGWRGLLYFYIFVILGNVRLASDQKKPQNFDYFGWDELVAHKRKLSGELKQITDKVIDIDKIQMHAIVAEIRERRSQIDGINEQTREGRTKIDKHNADLLSVSEKISQSKNFLSIMEARLPTESEESLNNIVKESQSNIDAKAFKSEREKNEILSRSKEASMKIEAIKATRVIRDQLAQLQQESSRISSSVQELEAARGAARAKMNEINGELDGLFEKKRGLSAQRESLLVDYDRIVKDFEAVNARLDSMSDMRKKQREEYGHGLPNDALFKVKETARKKLESGGKLSFEELKLLYEEKD